MTERDIGWLVPRAHAKCIRAWLASSLIPEQGERK